MKNEIFIACEFIGSILKEEQVCDCRSRISVSEDRISEPGKPRQPRQPRKHKQEICDLHDGKEIKNNFLETLQSLLFEKFRNHWHPVIPEQGQAYRAIYINHKPDSLLSHASKITGISLDSLPAELILWIDPSCVSYKLYSGPVVVLYGESFTSNPAGSPFQTQHVPLGYNIQHSPPPFMSYIGSPPLLSSSPITNSPFLPSAEFRAASASPISIKRPDGSNSTIKSLSPPRQQAALPLYNQREITSFA